MPSRLCPACPRRAPGEGLKAAWPRATAGASADVVVCCGPRTLLRLPRARVLRAGRRLGEVGGAGVAGAGGGRVRDLPWRGGGCGRGERLREGGGMGRLLPARGHGASCARCVPLLARSPVAVPLREGRGQPQHSAPEGTA